MRHTHSFKGWKSGYDFESIFDLCIRSKQTCVFKTNKLIAPTKNKHEEVHVDL